MATDCSKIILGITSRGTIIITNSKLGHLGSSQVDVTMLSRNLASYIDEVDMDNPDEEQYKSINRIDVVSSFDMLENIPSGMYANRLIVHDMINRKVENLDYDYAKEYSKMTHLESNKKTNRWGFIDDSSVDGQGSTMLIHESADELTTSPLSKQTLISRLDSTNDYYERTIQNRISQMQQINNIRLNL